MADIVYTGKAPSATLGVDLLPQNVDLALYKGDYLDVYVQITADQAVQDLSALTPKAVFRKSYADEATIELVCTVGVDNQVRLYLPSSISSTLEVGSYIWDFQLTNEDGDVRTYFAGDVTITDEVTK